MAEEERKADLGAGYEPWEAWESNLVKWSIISGIIALIILGAIVNLFILS